MKIISFDTWWTLAKAYTLEIRVWDDWGTLNLYDLRSCLDMRDALQEMADGHQTHFVVLADGKNTEYWVTVEDVRRLAER